ncbi:unnamed protein product, partial [Prorocentrum cordatum]
MNTFTTKHLETSYRAMPEEFYFETQLPVVTPDNLEDWMNRMSIDRIEVQERMSGSSRFSRRAAMQGLTVGFPVDYRYGWDMADSHHQKLLTDFRKRCFTDATLRPPTCTPWSIASRRKNSTALEADRKSQAPAIIFMREDIRQTLGTEQHHLAENPHNSDFWTKSNYTDIADLNIMRTFMADQCSYGATNELGEPGYRRSRKNHKYLNIQMMSHQDRQQYQQMINLRLSPSRKNQKYINIQMMSHPNRQQHQQMINLRRKIGRKSAPPEPEIAMKKWYEVKANFDLSKMVSRLLEATDRKELLTILMRCWIRYFGPMKVMVLDQEGGLVSDLSSRTCDKMNIERRCAGTDDHTMTGLVERWIQLVRLCAMKLMRTCTMQGFEVSDVELVQEPAMVSNGMVSYGGQTASQLVLGFTPNDYYDLEATALDSVQGADVSCPDPFEAAVRLRLLAKSEMARAIVEDRIARASRTRVQQIGPQDQLRVGDSVDIHRVPERKDQSGWRGPAELVKISEGTAIIVWNGIPYILPVRHVRKHLIGFLAFQTSAPTLEDNRNLDTFRRLMDIVDGSIYGQMTRLGKTIGQDGQTKCTAYIKTLVNLQPWKLSMITHETIFQLKGIDGVIYGTSLRRIPSLFGVKFGLLTLWERKGHANYFTFEVDPSKGVIINSLTTLKWENTSFLMFYSMPALVDPFLDEHRVPDMEDLSRIEVAPDSVRDVGRDVADMISLLPDLDDWMDATAAVPPAERSRLNETLT